MIKTVLILLITVFLLNIYPSAEQKVLVTAHRGDWRNAPENSLRAFQYAVAMGVIW